VGLEDLYGHFDVNNPNPNPNPNPKVGLEDLYGHFDVNNSGRISYNELQKALNTEDGTYVQPRFSNTAPERPVAGASQFSAPGPHWPDPPAPLAQKNVLDAVPMKEFQNIFGSRTSPLRSKSPPRPAAPVPFDAY